MTVLGIGGSNHDFNVSLVINETNIVSIEEERLSRIRYGMGPWYRNPISAALRYCLEDKGINLDDVDLIVANDHLEPAALVDIGQPIELISHHLSHAACAFLQSPLEKAAVLIIDGTGSAIREENNRRTLETISIGTGDGTNLELRTLHTGARHVATAGWRYMTTNSWGSLFEIMSDIFGFGEFGAGKLMGLSAYGDPVFRNEIDRFVTVSTTGCPEFNPYSGFTDWIVDTLMTSGNAFQVRADMAASLQALYEAGLIALARHVRAETGRRALCLAGGCALNSVANQRLLASKVFETVFIHPAPADSGTGLGAALYGYHHLKGRSRTPSDTNREGSIAYQGRTYSEDEVLDALNSHNVHFRRSVDVVVEVANAICEQRVVGWFQGRSELGYRALGNRSILADPTSPTMRHWINSQVKGRETFRPLAPVAPIEFAADYFDIDGEIEFMERVVQVRPERARDIPAVTHVDLSARLQTVTASSNPTLHALLLELRSRGKPPVLLNTSFNTDGYPIVETPQDAITCFLASRLDLLIIGGYVVEKHTPWA